MTDDEKPDEPKPGELLEAGHRRGDLRTIKMAIRRGWDIPEKALKALPIAIIKIIATEGIKPREKIRAIECIDRMMRTNIAAVEAEARSETREDGYTPSVEVHKHEHVHLENADATELVRVDDWYGTPSKALEDKSDEESK